MEWRVIRALHLLQVTSRARWTNSFCLPTRFHFRTWTRGQQVARRYV